MRASRCGLVDSFGLGLNRSLTVESLVKDLDKKKNRDRFSQRPVPADHEIVSPSYLDRLTLVCFAQLVGLKPL